MPTARYQPSIPVDTRRYYARSEAVPTASTVYTTMTRLRAPAETDLCYASPEQYAELGELLTWLSRAVLGADARRRLLSR